MGRRRPDTRSTVLQLLVDLGYTEWNEFGHDFPWLCLCHARNQMTECSNGVGLCVGRPIFVDKLEYEVEERARKLLADGVQHHFDRFQHGFFGLATGSVSLAPFFWQVLVQREHTPKEGENPVYVAS